MPSFFWRANGNFLKTNAYEANKIANVRVHVERAIKLVREFHIFDAPIPLNLADTVSQL